MMPDVSEPTKQYQYTTLPNWNIFESVNVALKSYIPSTVSTFWLDSGNWVCSSCEQIEDAFDSVHEESDIAEFMPFAKELNDSNDDNTWTIITQTWEQRTARLQLT